MTCETTKKRLPYFWRSYIFFIETSKSRLCRLRILFSLYIRPRPNGMDGQEKMCFFYWNRVAVRRKVSLVEEYVIRKLSEDCARSYSAFFTAISSSYNERLEDIFQKGHSRLFVKYYDLLPWSFAVRNVMNGLINKLYFNEAKMAIKL